MRALIVYESMYGNTHTIAEAIAAGMRTDAEVRVVRVAEATAELVAWADLVIAGGPTHARGLSSPDSRASAKETAAKPEAMGGWDFRLELDPAAEGPGIREWLETLEPVTERPAVAFDTRVRAPAFISGKASNAIAKGLREHGFRLVADAESFIVDSHNRLASGEVERATAWGTKLVVLLLPVG